MKYKTIPEDFLTKRIVDMAVGEVGYAVPWAMLTTTGERTFIKGAYTISRNPSGTATLRVLRSEDGFHVTIDPKGDHRWNKPMSGDPWDNHPLEVVDITII